MKIRNILLYFSLILLSTGLFSQTDNNYEYLSAGDWRLSGFGGYLIEFSGFDGELGVSNGGGGALLVNHTFFLGGYGMGLSNDLIFQTPDNTSLHIGFKHGGFWAGYLFKSNKVLHLGVSSKFGWGILSVDDNLENELDKDNVFVISPQLELEANVARWFKINAGLGYRYTAGVTNPYVVDDITNSPSFSLSFLFGWFTRYDQKDESREW